MPTNEPVVGQGPFVINSEEEVAQAFADYRSGKMGSIAARIASCGVGRQR
ncbi:MAG TPA: pirin-like C-terminal cupin domain-containing protein [Polaromonas sp.]